jgi:hypothetical protein
MATIVEPLPLEVTQLTASTGENHARLRIVGVVFGSDGRNALDKLDNLVSNGWVQGISCRLVCATNGIG